jgi:hypothetical protein
MPRTYDCLQQPTVSYHKWVMTKNVFLSSKFIGLHRPQRPIPNFAPKGANFDPRVEVEPRGELWPLGVKFSVRLSILLNSRECSTPGVNKGVNISFHPWGQVHPRGPGVKLRMAPRPLQNFVFTLGNLLKCITVTVFHKSLEPILRLLNLKLPSAPAL